MPQFETTLTEKIEHRLSVEADNDDAAYARAVELIEQARPMLPYLETREIERTGSAVTAHRLAMAILLFHGAGRWTDNERLVWRALTGEHEATTKALCDLARRTIKENDGMV